MKKVILVLAMVLVSFLCVAQSRDFLKFYDKYDGNDGVMCINIPGYLFGMVDFISGDTIEELSDVLSDVNKLNIFIISVR